MQKYVLPHTGLCHNSSTKEKLKILGAVAGTFLLVPLMYVLVVRGPLWPVGRLALLWDSNDKLEHEDIYNARAQRVLSSVALVCFVLAGLLGWAGWHYDAKEFYALAAILAIIYTTITAIFFERGLLEGLKLMGMLALMVFAIALPDEDKDD